ncbi:MAG: thiamine pyrophosphate-binding protein [Myxococcota bacterium]|nr:thiamine pyrophosphate-binding protein [Myxococcota bacterium]
MSDFPSLPADGTTPLPMLLARALKARGVTHAFGMPGGDTLSLLDAFREVGIDFVAIRHEGTAAFMADAVYHVTRTPGVCVATLGPGATNLVRGVAGSLLERSRVVAITNQIASHLRDRCTHQVIDHIELFKPITRRAVHVQGETAGMQVMMTLAAMERQAPGPVLLDIPEEMNAVAVPAVDPHWGRPRGPRPVPDVGAAAARLAAARRPVIAVGCGELSNTAANGVRRLQLAANAVGLTTCRGAGMLDEDHPLWAGTFGLSPAVDAVQQALLREADLLVAVGLDRVELRADWRPGWPDELPVILIDAHGQPDLMGNITDRLHGPLMQTLYALREAEFGESEFVV